MVECGDIHCRGNFSCCNEFEICPKDDWMIYRKNRFGFNDMTSVRQTCHYYSHNRIVTRHQSVSETIYALCFMCSPMRKYAAKAAHGAFLHTP